MASSLDPAARTLFVPVLDLSGGLPDPVAISTWHMALSNLVGSELPHQLFGLWVFPDRGGVVLLGPDDLAQDRLQVPVPDPFLTQDQLFDLEETLRQAKYASAAAIPIRTEGRDVGLLLIGTFEPGAYAAAAARLLRQLAAKLGPALAALGTMVTAAGNAAPPPADEENLTDAILAVVDDAPTGPELIRRLSGLIHTHVPHDRLEIVAYANGSKAAIPLSGQAGRRRWGAATSTWGDVVKLLNEFMGDQPTASIVNLAAEAPGLTLPGASGGPGRIGSVLGARLTLGGEPIGMIVAGHAAQDLFRNRDEAILERVARVVAPRIAAFRLESEAQGLRGQLEVLQAPSLPVLRAADSLATTAHLGEALHRFAAEVREVVPHDQIRFQLRISEDDAVELTPDTIRPLPDLPLLPIAELGARAVLENERPWTLIHRHDIEGLAVALRVAGRVSGAMVLESPHFEGPRDAAAVAQQFAAVAAPHLELLRRGALRGMPTAARKP